MTEAKKRLNQLNTTARRAEKSLELAANRGAVDVEDGNVKSATLNGAHGTTMPGHIRAYVNRERKKRAVQKSEESVAVIRKMLIHASLGQNMPEELLAKANAVISHVDKFPF